MTETQSSERRDRPGVAIGAILVVVGIVLFAGQVFEFDVAAVGWPFIVVAAGVAILLVGLLVAEQSGVTVAGTVVTVVGLVLLYQNTTGHWASWAYAWALVGPAASGLGLLLWGLRSRDGHDLRNGAWTLLTGLALFTIGFLFFEGIIGLGGERLPLPEWLLPVIVISIGVIVLVRAVLQRGDSPPP